MHQWKRAAAPLAEITLETAEEWRRVAVQQRHQIGQTRTAPVDETVPRNPTASSSAHAHKEERRRARQGGAFP